MFAPSFSVLLALASALAGVSSALPEASRLAQRDTHSYFSLFAYGSNSDTEIGGYPIFYNNGTHTHSLSVEYPVIKNW